MNLAVFASGRGSNLAIIASRIDDGELPARIAFVLTNNSDSGAINVASQHRIPVIHLSSVTHPDPDAYCKTMLTYLENHEIKLIVLAGFLKLIPDRIIQRFRGSIVNIHPAPLPEFGGSGMYGLKPHRAVLAAGLQSSKVCVHYVTADYDQGPVIASRKVKVRVDDTAESLQRRATAVEHDLYWRVIADIIKRDNG